MTALAISMRLPSVANLREHWRARARRSKGQRLAVALTMRTCAELKQHRARVASGESLTVTLIRVAPRPLDDDNLASAFKACRDQVAKELGTTDGPSGPLRWRYEQRRPHAPEATPGILILIAEGVL